MDYLIGGGHRLNGEVTASGCKNAVLPLLAASVLTDEPMLFCNCPDIADVRNMLLLLQATGKHADFCDGSITVRGKASNNLLPAALCARLRGSGLLLGSLLAKTGGASLPQSGGCAIGDRPMDIHIDGLRALGAEVSERKGICCRGSIAGGRYRLRMPSVGATENLLCAAAACVHPVTLENCAVEPEVEQLQQVLQSMGAEITGMGTSTVTVRGGRLHGCSAEVIPDRIECATYLATCAAVGGKVTVKRCVPRHLGAFLPLMKGGFHIEEGQDCITICSDGVFDGFGYISTAPYPGFHTDLQQITAALAAVACGKTVIVENMFENRLTHNASQLALMGANITVRGRRAEIFGSKLHGACITAADLRGGAALVTAALAAKGQSRVRCANHILRGYENFEQKLSRLGADIRAIED